MSLLRRIRRRWPVILGVLIALLIYAAWPVSSTFTISPETTYVTEPVDAKGYIDYPTALNERMGKGITPENNANVLIWQALGPRPEGGTMPPEYFKWLGIEQPAEQGEYFVDWDKYFQANLKTPPNDVVGLIEDLESWKKQWDDCIDRARKWPWKTEDQPAIADWLKRNLKPLALAIEASKRPQFFNPLVSESKDPRTPRLLGSLLPSVQKCREIANALKCRAMSHIADGDFEGAWQDLLACQRLGRLIARSGTLIQTLVGIALVATASDGELTLLSHSNQSSKKRLDWLADLQRLPPFPPLANTFDLGERLMCLDSLQSIASGGGEIGGPSTTNQTGDNWRNRLFSRSINWDPAFRNTNRTYDQLAASSRLSDRSSRRKELAKNWSDFEKNFNSKKGAGEFEKALMSASERGDRIGNIFLGLMVPAIEKIHDSADRSAQTQLNLQIAFALAAYRADNGRYPDKLDELAPKYLPSVSGDLFSGKPLIYKPTENGYLFYSVGINGIDDGGQSYDDMPKGDDLRVRMPVSEPKPKR